LVNGVAHFESDALNGIRGREDKEFNLPVCPKETFVSIIEAMQILGMSRRTFYIRVNRGEVEIHKQGRRSFVKKEDLIADKDLF
jgi:hypothetical protein